MSTGAERISSVTVSKIIELAADDDGWTEADIKTVEEQYGASADSLETVGLAIKDHFVSTGERRTLRRIMSGGDVALLAGKDGKELLKKRIEWFEKHPASRETMLNILNQENPVQLKTAVLRGLMASEKWDDAYQAEQAYENLVPMIKGELIGKEAASLRGLMSSGGGSEKLLALCAYINLASKIEGPPVGEEAIALRGLMSNGDGVTRWIAVDAYAAFFPKIEGPEVELGAIALRDLMLRGDRYVAKAYAFLAPKIEGPEVELGAIALRGLMSGGNEYTKHRAAETYKILAPKIKGNLAVSEIAKFEKLVRDGEIQAESVSGIIGILNGGRKAEQ